jgi:hypothetical protein
LFIKSSDIIADFEKSMKKAYEEIEEIEPIEITINFTGTDEEN